MNISGTSMLEDGSVGQPITVVEVDVNGSSVYATYITSASKLVTAQSFIGRPLLSSAVIN